MDRSPAVQKRRAGNSGCCSNGRPWVLVDSTSRIGCRRNATIAETLTSRGFAVRVSFELADPPAVSLCFVHSPGRDERHFNGDPHILSVAQGFLLLVISFTGDARQNSFHDYFVYRAGPGRPRLDLIPVPHPRYFDHKHVGILPVGDHYAVAIPVSSYNNRACSMNFKLRVFWSASRRWTTKNAPLARDSETDYLKAVSHRATRVISVGGGVLGWVDLWWGLLLCNVVDDNPIMRLLQWPIPEPDFEFLDPCLNLSCISPRPFRDVAVVNGSIKFVELKFHEYTTNLGWWTATIWSRMVSSLDWCQSSTVHADDISIVDSVLTSRISVLLPEILDKEGKRLTWGQVTCSSPTLSLTNDDVVHIMASPKSKSQIAYVLVVNIRTKTLEALEQYRANKMILLEPTYIASAFSGYLDMTSCDVCPVP